jgi:hypothetical protein
VFLAIIGHAAIMMAIATFRHFVFD